MTKEQERELERAEQQDKHWREVGGIIYDVMTLLESISRIGGHGLSEYEAEKLASVRRAAPLVASHALNSALAAVNHESMRWGGVAETIKQAEELGLTEDQVRNYCKAGV